MAASRQTLARQDTWALKGTEHALKNPSLISEVRYGEGSQERMDYIYPVTVQGKKLSVLIYVHGGGWVAGTKEARRLYCSLLAE